CFADSTLAYIQCVALHNLRTLIKNHHPFALKLSLLQLVYTQSAVLQPIAGKYNISAQRIPPTKLLNKICRRVFTDYGPVGRLLLFGLTGKCRKYDTVALRCLQLEFLKVRAIVTDSL